MNARRRKSLLSGVPSLALAVFALLAQVILLTGLAFVSDIVGLDKMIDENISEPILYIIWALIIAACCYFIIRKDPKSIWYVPVICNIIGIISAIIEPNFWITPLGIYTGGGIVLSIITSIFGYVAGRKRARANRLHD